MEKIIIKGEQYIKVRTLMHTMQYLRRAVPVFYNFAKTPEEGAGMQFGARDILFQLHKEIFKEEYAQAEGIEDYKALREIPGDYHVFRWVDDEHTKMMFFVEWTGKSMKDWYNYDEYSSVHCAMTFNYESKAEEVAETLTEHTDYEWHVLNMSPEMSHKLIPVLYPKRMTEEEKKAIEEKVLNKE